MSDIHFVQTVEVSRQAKADYMPVKPNFLRHLNDFPFTTCEQPLRRTRAFSAHASVNTTGNNPRLNPRNLFG